LSTPERFIDGIGNLAVQGAVARVELTVIEKLPAKDEAPTYEVTKINHIISTIDSPDKQIRLLDRITAVTFQFEYIIVISTP